MASQLASLEEDRKQYQEQMDVVLAGLKDDPDSAELKNLQAELNEMISMIDESIAELRPKQAHKPAAPQKDPTPPEPEKWTRENHPAFKKTSNAAPGGPPPAEEKDDPTAVSYNVNDSVLAKWVSGDKAFYPARITSITGSATAPVYIVKFKTYDNTETLRAKDIRPVSNKRKADGTPASSGGNASPYTSQPTDPTSSAPSLPAQASSSTSNNGVVTSASASIYPDQQAKLDAEKRGALDAAAKPPKPKKIKATKELEKGKSKWQEFSAKSKYGKSHKKDSMFRTPEGVHGRVGFTGSGQAMRKDPTRSRHIYQQNEELD